jgi:hypothetical protein
MYHIQLQGQSHSDLISLYKIYFNDFYMKYSNKIFVTLLLAFFIAGCTKLDEDLQGTLTLNQAVEVIKASGGSTVALNGVYADLSGPFHNQDRVFSLQENTTDECLVPTRGSDWDDNGAWRVMHTHQWDANHTQITGTFNQLLKIVFDATNVLTFDPTPKQAAEAKFLRAFAMYQVLDFWGQIPFRQPGDNLLNAPLVLKGVAALDTIIKELNDALPVLNNTDPPTRATQNAAKFLLMRCYLNKGAFANRQAPTFAAADLAQVITLGQSIITSGKYSLASNYFDNFGPNNTTTGLNEAIFSYPNATGSSTTGNINSRWKMTIHYNSFKPGAPDAGWNGFATLSDFYNLFGTTDKRRTASYPGSSDYPGSSINAGFLVGQQVYAGTGELAKDRKNNPLFFTPAVKLAETDPVAIENAGIRVIKYPPDFTNGKATFDGGGNNDLMIFRYADVVLMVAEAQLRGGGAGVATALAAVNNLRAIRGATPLGAITLDALLEERGREFYWEMIRRSDLIRFGKFLQAWQLKAASDPKVLYFPIPASALAVNPNLTQNPGY